MIIGLTGPMGAGKSTAAEMFKKMGWPVFDADAQIHDMMANDRDVRDAFMHKIPQAVTADEISRPILSRLLTENKISTADLEQILYPFLQKRLENFVIGKPYVVLDIPLLFEAGWDKFCDKIVYITADSKTIKERVFKRSGMTEEKYKTLTERFWQDDVKIQKSDYVIRTDKGFEPEWNKLVKIKEELCAKSF